MKKVLSLILVFIMLFTSMGTGIKSFPNQENLKYNYSTSYYSADNLILFCLPQQTSSSITAQLNFQLPKIDTLKDFLIFGLNYELKLDRIVTRYIYVINNILPGLSVKDIIYPFHYFW